MNSLALLTLSGKELLVELSLLPLPLVLLNFIRKKNKIKRVTGELNQDTFLFKQQVYNSEAAMEAEGTRGFCTIHGFDNQFFPFINTHSEHLRQNPL